MATHIHIHMPVRKTVDRRAKDDVSYKGYTIKKDDGQFILFNPKTNKKVGKKFSSVEEAKSFAAYLNPDETKDAIKPYISSSKGKWEVLNSKEKVAKDFPKTDEGHKAAQEYLRSNWEALSNDAKDSAGAVAKVEREIAQHQKLIDAMEKNGKDSSPLKQKLRFLQEELQKAKATEDAFFTTYDPREVSRLRGEIKEIDEKIKATKGPISKRDLELVKAKLEKELSRYHDAEEWRPKLGEMVTLRGSGARVKVLQISPRGNVEIEQYKENEYVKRVVKLSDLEVPAGSRDAKDAFPSTVKYKGKTYYRTGKTGKSFATGEAVEEYEDDDTHARLWLSVSGKITEDAVSPLQQQWAQRRKELERLLDKVMDEIEAYEKAGKSVPSSLRRTGKLIAEELNTLPK